MKIAILRGPYVNKFELQNYEPLAKKQQVTVFYPNNNFFDVSEIKLPKEKVTTYESIFGKKISDYLRIPLHFPFGYYHGIPGLEKKLKNFDIVHGAEAFYIFDRQIIKAKERYGCKAVFTVWENIPFAHESMPFLRKCKKEVLKKADLFVAISERTKIALMLEGVEEKRIVVIPAGLDLTRFQPGNKDKQLLKQLNISRRDFVVSFIGRFTYEKGIFELLNAFALLTKKIDNLILFLVGEGPLKKKMTERIKRLNIEKKVRFASFPYKKMPNVHRLANVFVLPSIPLRGWQEQFGMVLIEAMASGIPIITTASGSIPEVVGDSALLIQPADTLAIYEAILKIYHNKNERQNLIKKGLARAKNFDCNLIAKKLEEAYEKLA